LNAKSQFTADERRDLIKEKVVQARARLPPNLNDILESRRCDQRDAGAFSLQQSIGADGGAVQQCDGSSSAAHSCRVNFSESFGNRARRIVGCREYFQSFESAALHPHTIGERASSVDCDAECGMRYASHVCRKMNREDYHRSPPAQ